MMIIIVKLYLLNRNGWTILYAIYRCIEDKASFIYPLEKSASGALWITYGVKIYNTYDKVLLTLRKHAFAIHFPQWQIYVNSTMKYAVNNIYGHPKFESRTICPGLWDTKMLV